MKGLALVAIFSLFISGLTLGQVVRYKSVILYDSSFRNTSNQTLIDNVSAKGLNTVFLMLKVCRDTDPDDDNLGLEISSGSNPYEYLDKVVDFCDAADASGIKVFAFQCSYDGGYQVSDKRNTVLNRIERISYYQKRVRNTPFHPQYKGKKAHFHGIVTNLEPWALGKWENGGGDDYDLCDIQGRNIDNGILDNHFELVGDMYALMVSEGYFNPDIAAPYTLQSLDNVFMGTTHWNFHYFSQKYSNFPNGNHSKWVGVQNIGGNQKHLFDILLVETYCPKLGNTCLNNNCTANNTTLCTGDPNDPDNYANLDKVGGCYDWFEKHYFSDEMYDANEVIPIDAAPMLVGHAGHMHDTWIDMKNLMYETYYRPTYCMQNNNYRGYFVFKYASMMYLPHGISVAQPPINCGGAAITKSITDTTDINIRQVLLYPNPADKMINLKGLWKGDKSIIYDLNFNTHLTSYSETIDVSALKPGNYMLTVIDENGKIVNRQTFLIRRNY